MPNGHIRGQNCYHDSRRIRKKIYVPDNNVPGSEPLPARPLHHAGDDGLLSVINNFLKNTILVELKFVTDCQTFFEL